MTPSRPSVPNPDGRVGTQGLPHRVSFTQFLHERWGEDLDCAREARRTHMVGTGVQATHYLERLGPGHTLSDIAAKRLILAAYVEHAEYDDEDNSFEHATGRIVGLGEALRHLAVAYSYHPDYRPEWRP